jgi:tetratricopeptide (TPR) repeat protein
MSPQNMVMIFRGDELLKSGNTASYETEGKGLNTKGYLPPGEYTVVHCGVSCIVNQYTVTKLGVRRAQFDIPVFFSNLFFIDEKTPENVTTTELTPKDLSRAQCDKIISHLKSQGSWFWDYAVPEVKKALKPVLSIEDEAHALVSQGRILISQKGFQQAIPQFEQAIRIYPKISGARVDLGKAKLELRRVEEAIQSFEEELTQASDPEVLNANLYLAAICDAKGNAEKSRMHLAAVVATADYRRNPISMDPAVVRKIKAAVAAQVRPISSMAVPGTTQKPTTDLTRKQRKSAPTKKWWQFWK